MAPTFELLSRTPRYDISRVNCGILAMSRIVFCTESCSYRNPLTAYTSFTGRIYILNFATWYRILGLNICPHMWFKVAVYKWMCAPYRPARLDHRWVGGGSNYAKKRGRFWGPKIWKLF